MKLSDLLIPEFDQEMTTARKTLERIPEDKLSWKPHQKSMPLDRLAGHIAELAGWAVPTIEQDSLDFRWSIGRRRYIGVGEDLAAHVSLKNV